MSDSLPLMNAYGKIESIFDKMHVAQKPPKFTLDFLETKLGFKSTSDRAIVPLLVKLHFISADRVPTELYSEFQNNSGRKTAVAKGMKRAYKDIFEINQYAYDLNEADTYGIFSQATGLAKDSAKLRTLVNTFLKLKSLADFEEQTTPEAETSTAQHSSPLPNNSLSTGQRQIQWGYTININLPETSDIEVFDAIFSSMKKHFYND